MRKLYLRIYFALLASLVAFAIATALLWHAMGEQGPWSGALEMAGTLAQNVLPPAAAPQAEQQAALEKLAANLRIEVALLDRDAVLLAAVPLRSKPGFRPRAIQLPDGRRLEVRVPHGHGWHASYGLLMLVLLALAVAVGAYPVVRRLTSRLERLQAGVESLGAGDLSARARVEGHDEVARLAESFNRAAARIEELVGAHKALLANASHELRTPLARIRMAVELMKQDADPRFKSALERDIAELDALIDEILLASRLDAIKDSALDEDVDLLALAAEECARYENVELGGEPLTVRGDSRLLRRMIRNLLENAKRYGAPPIEVRVSTAGSRVELRVCDRGPGVPEAERARVFDRFYRRDTGPNPSAGAGLGLALVRQIAERHRGEARYAPQQGGGGCFVVSLPAASR